MSSTDFVEYVAWRRTQVPPDRATAILVAQLCAMVYNALKRRHKKAMTWEDFYPTPADPAPFAERERTEEEARSLYAKIRSYFVLRGARRANNSNASSKDPG